ncbi:MAG TPA: hypothetical protein VNN08_22350, partial [Thermoanaerobaculia bacterium]|nr:hypothetical protein [Thermoanaerobaculia bacterium]
RAKRVVVTLIGVVLGFGVLAVGDYYMSPTEHVIGFPFLALMFIKKRGVWLDYLGPFTVPALLANGYVGFTLPFIAASVWLRSRQEPPN